MMHNVQDTEKKTLYCGAPGMGEDVTDYIVTKPDFCPLRELPDDVANNINKN